MKLLMFLVAPTGLFAPPAFGDDVPDGFMLQILEPTGGKIFRPIGWTYQEAHTSNAYNWIISKEDPDLKPIQTSVRVVWYLKTEKQFEKAPKKFINDFIAEKVATADKVIKICEPEEMYLFTRVCLETEEGPNHILYSLFWEGDASGSNSTGMAFMMIKTAKKADWSHYLPTFDQIPSVELIDMTHQDRPGRAYPLPPAAHYDATDESIDAAVALLATNLVADPDILTNLFSTKAMCGPGLWRLLKDSSQFLTPPRARGIARMPMGNGVTNEAAFAFLQGYEEVSSFRRALALLLKTQGKLVIREPNQKEFMAYWATINYDRIDDPMLVAVGSDYTFFCQFLKDKVFLMDEVQKADFATKAVEK